MLFGQLLSELYEANVLAFIGELRSLIESECSFKILAVMTKSGVEGVKIPYSKIRSIVDKIVIRNELENSLETFMEKLKQQHPTVMASHEASH